MQWSFNNYSINITFNIISECEVCEKPGHTCDMDTGRCVCPQLTEGPNCSQCTANAFRWEINKGCQVGFWRFIERN